MSTENDTDSDDDRSSFEFHDAVGKMVPVLNTLATSREPLRERILHAYIGGLSRIRSNSLPSGLREEFESLVEHLSSKPIENAHEGRIHATLRAMSDHEAQEAAKRIIRFHYAIQEEVVRRECQRLER